MGNSEQLKWNFSLPYKQAKNGSQAYLCRSCCTPFEVDIQQLSTDSARTALKVPLYRGRLTHGGQLQRTSLCRYAEKPGPLKNFLSFQLFLLHSSRSYLMRTFVILCSSFFRIFRAQKVSPNQILKREALYLRKDTSRDKCELRSHKYLFKFHYAV